MELHDGDEKAAQGRSALLQELALEREAGTPEHLFGAPRLERFLQGNEGSVTDAAAHFRKMLHWRSEANVAEMRKQVVGKPWSPDSVPGLRNLLRTLAADVESHTLEGDLIWVQCDGLARLDRLMEVTDKELFTIMTLMCELRQDHLDNLSEKSGRLVKGVQIRDLAGFSVAGLLKDRAIMGRLQTVLKMVNLAYPESMRKLVIINLPAGFNLLWAALQPLMNARIRSKFCFLSKDNYVPELAELAGSRALEALARARRGAAPAASADAAAAGKPAGEIQVPAGLAEYACHRMDAGQTVTWSYHVSPAGTSGGLRFTVLFICDSWTPPSREVSAASTATGSVRGSYKAEAHGLLWLMWTNPGTWARTKTVEGLRLELRDPAAASPVRRARGGALSFPGGERWRLDKPRSGHRDCGCLGFLHLIAPGVDGGSSRASNADVGQADRAGADLPPPSSEGARQDETRAAEERSRREPPLLLDKQSKSEGKVGAARTEWGLLQTVAGLLFALSVLSQLFEIFQRQITEAMPV